jgi:hypothetical protein
MRAAGWDMSRNVSNIAIFLIFLAIAVLRNPVYLLFPNFYAEDGTVFFKDSYSHGFLSLFETFNGYPILGIRLISLLGTSISLFPFFHNLVLVAIMFSLLSYIFWALLAFLTVRELRHFVETSWAYLGGFLVLLMPLSGWNYAILGTLGNLKFGFLYLAFLLMVERLHKNNWTKSNKFIFVICVLTNPTSAIFLPFFYLSRKKLVISKSAMDYLFGSLTIIVVVLIYVNSRKYILPKEYVSGNWTFWNFLKVVTGQTFIFPLNSSLYSKNSLLIGLLALLVTLVAFSKLSPISRLFIISSFLCAMFLSSFILFNRQGLILFYSSPTNPGPAQFFYPQNMIVIFCFVIIAESIMSSIGRSFVLYKMAPVFFFCLYIWGNYPGIGFGGLGPNAAWQKSFSSIEKNTDKACKGAIENLVNIEIIPGVPWKLTLPENVICK